MNWDQIRSQRVRGVVEKRKLCLGSEQWKIFVISILTNLFRQSNALQIFYSKKVNMGNYACIEPHPAASSLEFEHTIEPDLLEDTNLTSISPIHRYTNYQTTMSLKSISSLKNTNENFCGTKQLNKENHQLLVSPEIKKRNKKPTILLENPNQQQIRQIKNLPVRSPTKNKTFKSVTFLKQHHTTKSIASSHEETQFKSLVINFESFVDLKQQKIDEFYDFKEVLGEGAYGQVFRAICKKTGQDRAIKKIKIKSMKQQKRKQFLSELSLLSRLCHPSIIVVYDVFLNNDKYYVVMEYCKGGAVIDMLHRCKKKSENTISYIMKQLLSALSYMHSQNIVHRDIKLDNIVFLNPVMTQSQDENIPIKIIDFGTAVSYQGKQLHDYPIAGTLSYLAPEVMKGILTSKSDIWSAGVLLIILLTGKSPFKGNHQNITKANINNKKLKFNDPPLKSLSPQVKQLIGLMLERNHNKRITAAQALNHPWFKNSHKIKKSLQMQNLQQLFKYHKGNNLISVIESYISLKRITQEERQRLGEMFSAIDTDGNGTIDIRELVQIYSQNIDSNHTQQEITQIIKSIDKDKSGKIDFNEFIVVMQGRKNLFITEFLADAFDYYDEDKTGYLDREQITGILKGGDIVEINKIIKQLDKDGDKRISKQQFISYFKNY